MRKINFAEAAGQRLCLAAAALALGAIGGLAPTTAHAAGTTPAPAASPLSDAWQGDKLDTARWHVSVIGDAQQQDTSIKVANGLLHLMAAGSDTWVGGDNNLYLWQPANGDFQVTLEMHSVTKTNEAAKVGIMVRTSLSKFSPNVFLQGMPKGGTMQVRQPDAVIGSSDTGPGSGCAGPECNPWGDNSGDITTMPTILQRMTRKGSTFTAERSYDGGKTWGGLHTGSLAAQDTQVVNLPDDVLVGIAYDSHDAATVGEAVLGPILFTQLATRPTDNGLLAATATDASGQPVDAVGLIVKQGNTQIGTSVITDSNGDPQASNTASFYLKPGLYTVETAENDSYKAGTPVPFEIKTGQVQDLKVKVGAAK